MKTRLAATLCGIAGMLGIAEAQLVDGQTIGIDFGVTNPVTNDFIEYAFNAGTVAVTK
ncbi:MAG: hypothetical protein HKO57_09710, partial [Akkermansiaceae bacterium]|nr:hypothetical protein [Akkermansiaceae bacterium]